MDGFDLLLGSRRARRTLAIALIALIFFSQDTGARVFAWFGEKAAQKYEEVLIDFVDTLVPEARDANRRKGSGAKHRSTRKGVVKRVRR